jgi:SpoIID/LytB domain protein
MRREAALLALVVLTASRAAADDLSAADKLRVVYSNQFAWTTDGLPLVTVGVARGRDRVVITAPSGGVRVLPDGEGGAEVRGGRTFTLRVEGGRPGRVRWHVIAARLAPGDERLPSELQRWRERGFSPHTFEVGAVFGVRGEVLDSRRILVAVAARDDEPAARAEAARIGKTFAVEAGVHPELVERPRGVVEATDEHGAVVRNADILWFAPAEPRGVLQLDDVDKESGGREPRRYFGKLYVTVDGDGKLAVVNSVPEDKLLAGLVPAEMSPSSPPEALKAQAVAARNELLAKIGTRHLTDPYRLCAAQHCQVYAGAGREDPRSTAAVAATRGELLVRSGTGGLIDAVYSASCGGHTEDNDRAWGGAADESLRGALDADEPTARALSAFARVGEPETRAFLAHDPAARPFCARPRGADRLYRWTVRVDAGTVAARTGIGRLVSVEVLERGVSGRVVKLRLAGDRGSREIRGELEVRRALGNLKSALIAIDVERDAAGRPTTLVVQGGGHGHGIGMCQMGAVGMAEAGKSYREILGHYYPSSSVKKLY